jgi:hypothetical protein
MLKAFFDFAITITLQALRFQPNRWHQSIQRKNLHYIDIWHIIPGALFFRQNALRHQFPNALKIFFYGILCRRYIQKLTKWSQKHNFQ